MQHPDRMRELLEQLSTMELLRNVYLHGNEFEEQAMGVIKEVLDTRGGLMALYSQEIEKSGEELLRIVDVERFMPLIEQKGMVRPGERRRPASGHFLLTTTGLGFCALSAHRGSIMFSDWITAVIGGMGGWGLLHFMERQGARPAGEQGLNLPISLLAQIDLLSVFYPAAKIEKIELGDRDFTITAASHKAHAAVPSGSLASFRSWGDRVLVPIIEIEPRRKGFFSRLLGRR